MTHGMKEWMTLGGSLTWCDTFSSHDLLFNILSWLALVLIPNRKLKLRRVSNLSNVT